ncbi:MAG: hypothetical protein AAFU55_12355, partial [Pseudomonadota bacterium]
MSSAMAVSSLAKTPSWTAHPACGDAAICVVEGPAGAGSVAGASVRANTGRGAGAKGVVDADCVVAPDALTRLADAMADHTRLGAAFGSYDAHPPGRHLAGQYKNLLHH